jgi:hypothetical protein
MLKNLRVAALVYVLLFVAVGQYLTSVRSTDWDSTLWVDIYPIDGDARPATREYVDNLTATEFSDLERFFAGEARRYGLELDRPFRLNLATPIDQVLPRLEPNPSTLDTLVWSLRMRWLAMTLRWQSAGPSADVVAFAVFHDGADAPMLDRSTALEKGLIVVANLFADRRARGSNQVVLAHELLHTLGASDKYDVRNNAPLYPHGFAEPKLEPLYPQRKAELMAGRVPIDASRHEIPRDLRQVVIGAATALEIGWLRGDR